MEWMKYTRNNGEMEDSTSGRIGRNDSGRGRAIRITWKRRNEGHC